MDDENRHESVYHSNSCIHHHGIARIHILKHGEGIKRFLI